MIKYVSYCSDYLKKYLTAHISPNQSNQYHTTLLRDSNILLT